MKDKLIEQWRHTHTFGQDVVRAGEKRTLIVIIVTAAMMVFEIAAGLLFGSMALLADGLHMASHAAALAITAFAYQYARKRAADETFSFGTGKVNALGGYTGAVLLAIFALLMVWESIERLLHPIEIAYFQAISVAIVGLIVNGVSALILGHDDAHGHHDHHDNDHGHDHDHHHHHADHNLRSAYLHVMADALTSVLAIVALLCARFFQWNWADPMMGVLGAFLVARWSWSLIRDTSGELLDKQASTEIRDALRAALENDDDQIADLHVWSIGPGFHAAEVSIVSREPQSPSTYKSRIPHEARIRHCNIEVHHRSDNEGE